MHKLWRFWLHLLLIGLPVAAFAAPLADSEIPAPLKSWEAWVLHDADTRHCPLVFDDDADARLCSWPSRLSLSLKDSGGSFVLTTTLYTAGWVALPGDDARWPQAVRADNAAAPVAQHGDAPSLWLAAGTHRIDGNFNWSHLPESLPTPADAGLVTLEVGGVARPNVVRDGAGQLWLGRVAAAAVEGSDHLSLKVFRLIDDDIPLRMTVHLDLEVAGRAREAVLGPMLPKDYIPLMLSGGLPARLDDGGLLHVQLRPGLWSLELTARAPAPVSRIGALALPAPWPVQEIWSLQAHNDLRVVEPGGAPAVDPRQTQMPDAWRNLPAFLMTAGTSLDLVEKQRGNLQAEPDALTLQRELWLDFDGGGWTLRDSIGGALHRHWRVSAGAPLLPGRVDVDGAPQLITKSADGGAGVEVRHGLLNLVADSRIDSAAQRLPVAGWNVDFQSVATTLHLPPGWRLFATAGADNVPQTWIARWTLLDLFVVMVVATAALRLFGLRVGALTPLTLALCWHEPQAPRWSWLNLVAALALVQAMPEAFRQHALMRWLQRYAALSAALLLLWALPFAVQQARWALYPQLETPQGSYASSAIAMTGFAAGRPATAEPRGSPATQTTEEEEDKSAEAPPPPPAEEPAPAPLAMSAAVAASTVNGPQMKMRAAAGPIGMAGSAGIGFAKQSLQKFVPGELTQTGPGLPDWSWGSAQLSWSGPVVAGQEMRLWLLPPAAVRLWRLASILLIALLLFLWTRGRLSLQPPPAARSSPRGPAAVLAPLIPLAIALLLTATAPAPVRADDAAPAAAADGTAVIPQPPLQALLDQLKSRLLAPPDCVGACADVPRMSVEVKADVLSLRLTIDALADTAVPVPAPAFASAQPLAVWQPTAALLDAHDVPLRRADGGTLWIAVGKGRHELLLSGSLAGLTQLQLPLTLKPHAVDVSAQGWQVSGVNDDGTAGDALQLTRQQKSAAAEAGAEQALPNLLVVTRTLHLGLSWDVETSVHRVGSGTAPLVAHIPLLPGEILTSDALHAKDGLVEISFAADQLDAGWNSRLPVVDKLTLSAARTSDYVEQWRLDASPLWHVEMSGIPPVQYQQNQYWLPSWQPWPGETVTLAITRPQGVTGQILTLDQASLTVNPGSRATDATLQLRLRASQGGQHVLGLPEAATVQALIVDGQPQPAHVEASKLTLSLHPGTQQVTLQLRLAQSVSTWLRTPAIDPGLPGVNASIIVNMPQDRWLLWLHGPQLGPAVLFWGLLGVLMVLAVALGRLPLTPLRRHHWLLLLIGLSQGPLWALAVVLSLWPLLGLRGRVSEALPARRFQVMQIGVALLTIGAGVLLFRAVAAGLLGAPDMQIAGNGSYDHSLRWYQDRYTQGLPSVGVLSLPLWVYRVLMLVWSLWLANALLGWLRWGWVQYTRQGLWKRVVRDVPPPAGDDDTGTPLLPGEG